MSSHTKAVRIDWSDLYKRLYVYARKLTSNKPDIFDGVSAADLAGETILEFLESESQLGFDPKIATISTFLCVVLKRRTIDHIRRHSRVKGSLDDPDFNPSLEVSSGERLLHEAFAVEEMIRSVRTGSSDPELVDLIRATSSLSGDGKVNQQLAEILLTSTENVMKRKKRLVRMLKGQKKR